MESSKGLEITSTHESIILFAKKPSGEIFFESGQISSCLLVANGIDLMNQAHVHVAYKRPADL
ncbi:MAG: hypothetical protein DRH17_00570 [Deltaproteobacteria bacterium]|nr:MAG: hypothetical protein DRH17_00570 [Deltaproteobacteria bacterium]